MAQTQIAEATSYFKGILDSMMSNLREKQAANQAEFEAALDEKVTQMKEEAEASALESIDQLQNTIDQAYLEVTEFVETDLAALDDEVFLMKKAPEVEAAQGYSSSFMFGCGALALGAISTMGYLYKKSKETKVVKASEFEENLIDDDE